MQKRIIVFGLIFILIIINLSGCIDFFAGDGSTTYEAHPTKLSYKISYGYKINCTGAGGLNSYNLKYDLDLPEVLEGQIIETEIHNADYEDKILATFNSVKSWDIDNNVDMEYNLGLTSTIQSESFIVSDLNGANALSIEEISSQCLIIIIQYCQEQYNETTRLVDPENPYISDKASEILHNSGTNNSFLVAKELFIWLKQNIRYQIHLGENNAQPAETTFQIKTGDCDDLSFLYISLCRSVGIPSRFIRGFLIEEETAVPHEWVEVFVGGGLGNDGWIPVECAGVSDDIEAEVHQNFGLESAAHLRLFTDDGSNESLCFSQSSLTYVLYGSTIVEYTNDADVNDYNILESKELFVDKNGIRSYK